VSLFGTLRAKFDGFLKSEKLKTIAGKYVFNLIYVMHYGFFLLVVVAMGFHWKYVTKAPVQPIPFPHPTHVTMVGLPCTYCHQYVDQSRRAGVPSVQLCMSCHRNVATERPAIKKLTEYWDNREPIPWVRIHKLPDHVHFSHKRHVKRNIDCSVCHGELKTMDVVRRVRSLKMGWCVRCHEANGASIDCYTCHK